MLITIMVGLGFPLLRRASDLRIGVRLGAAFAAVLSLLAAMTAVAAVNLAELNAGAERIVGVEYPKTQLETAALDNTRGSIARVFQIVTDPDLKQVARARERLQINLRGFSEPLATLGPMLAGGDGEALLARARESGRRYSASVEEVLHRVDAGQRDEARALAFAGTYERLHAFADDLRALLELSQTAMAQAGVQSARTYAHSRGLLIAVGFVAVAIGVLLAWLTTRSITRPIRAAVKIAQTVAAGDLSSRIEVRAADEAGQLLAALKHMNERLIEIVGEVRQASDSIATGSSQIAGGNADLSRRTEQQASDLQQTAAAMEQLTAAVRNNADAARQATQTAAGASAAAAQGGDVVEQVVSTMDAISASSRRMADIIGVIDGIAFQTNILALNAAVEAARAGVHGRGFAVVATEVRTLAQSSAQSARQIRALIDESIARVDQGSRLVGDAGRTMSEIVLQVKRVASLIGEIGGASTEQSGGISQIGCAVAHLDQSTQQNAALVEQCAAAAESLRLQAAHLAQAVSKFRLGGETTR